VSHPRESTRSTPRLRLRRWRETDREPFAEMNRHPEVMRYFVRPLDRAESDALIDRIEAQFEERGFGLWVVERKDDEAFLGFTGLLIPKFDAHFTPCVEVGWRLDQRAWGHGYATEAASEALRFGFEEANLDQIVSFAPLPNIRSIRVMARLGMTHDPQDDFDHPLVPAGHRLRRHVLYRLRRETFSSGATSEGTEVRRAASRSDSR
jgi:RimJ/RimL family protein N-acetyltransferase